MWGGGGLSRTGLIAFLLILATGCGISQSQKGQVEKQVQDQIQSHRELLKILKSVQDRESMKAALSELREHAKKAGELQNRGSKLSTPDKEMLEKMRPYALQLENLLKDQATELQRIKSLPDGQAFIDRLQQMRTMMQLGQ